MNLLTPPHRRSGSRFIDIIRYSIPFIALIFVVVVVPTVYTEVFLWARFGDRRLVVIGFVVLLLLLFAAKPNRPNIAIASMLGYQVTADLVHYGTTTGITVLNVLGILSLAIMLPVGATLTQGRAIARVVLMLLVFCLGAVIICNSITVLNDIRFIRGLNLRRDLDNFNYLLVADSFAIAALFMFQWGRIDASKVANQAWVLFCITTLWCTGSRVSLVFFVVAIAVRYVAAYRERRIALIRTILFLSVVPLHLVVLGLISQPSVTARYNPNDVTADASLHQRIDISMSHFFPAAGLSDSSSATQPVSNLEGGNELIAERLVVLKWLMATVIARGPSVVFGEYMSGDGGKLTYQHNVFSNIDYYGVPFFIFFVVVTVKLFNRIRRLDVYFPLLIYFAGTLLFRDDVTYLWWFLVAHTGVSFGRAKVGDSGISMKGNAGDAGGAAVNVQRGEQS